MWRPTRRQVAWTSAGVGAFLVVAVVIVSWFSGQGLLHPDRELVAATPADVGLPFERILFNATDGVPLVGWWIPADATPDDNRSVIFLHGYGDSKAQSLEVAPFLHNASYNVLAFDFRASGESGGSYTTAGLLETRDIEGAVSWLKARPGMPGDPWIALFGWSMGGAAAIRAAPSIASVDAVVSDGAFSRLQNIVDTSIPHFFKKTIGVALPRWPFGPLAVTFAGWSIGKDIADNRPAESIKSLARPVLLIHGSDDTTVPPRNLEELAAAAGPHATTLLVPGAAHTLCYQQSPAVYEHAVLAFLAGVPAT